MLDIAQGRLIEKNDGNTNAFGRDFFERLYFGSVDRDGAAMLLRNCLSPKGNEPNALSFQRIYALNRQAPLFRGSRGCLCAVQSFKETEV